MRLLIILITGMLAALSASAHEIRPAFLELVETAPKVWQATFKQPRIQGRFPGLEVITNCNSATAPMVAIDAGALEQTWEIHCEADELSRIHITRLDHTMIDTLVTIHYQDATTLNHLITPGEPQLDLSRDTPWLPVYLVMGIEHLLLGFDHLLFVVVLMFVVRGIPNLIKAITSFTVAHSITLGLSAFDLLTVPQTPVEATIALSILILSLQAFQPGKGNPWLVAFIFGLLHGLGFAGALKDIGLPEDTALWALLFFNLGIEIGQLGIIALMLTMLFLIRQMKLPLPAYARAAPLYVAGSMSAYWLIQRTAQIVF